MSLDAFGRHLGIAYQIYDDLADFFGEEKRIGKTLGTDLASGKLTLPLLLLMERLTPAERTDLTGEILGQHPVQPALRLRQMGELGIFGAVVQAVMTELDGAACALQEWREEGPTPLLLGLGDVLRNQVAALRPAD